MKLSISKDVLIAALQIITPITDKSSSKPILSNFLMTARSADNVIEFSATDYEISLKGEFPAQVEEDGTVCISAKKVFEVCREFQSEEISIRSDAQLWVTLEGGKSRLRLPSVETGLYPTMDVPELSNRFSIAAGALKRCIDLTIFASLANETRKNLMGVCLRLKEEGKAQFVATDGHRLAQIDSTVEVSAQDEVGEVIVPRKSLMEMQRVLDRTNDNVEIAFDERNLVLNAGSIVLLTRLIEGKFPNVDPVIPKDNDKEVLVNRERMINALKIVSFMSNDKIKPVKFSLENNALRLESEQAEYGDVVDELPVEYSGEEIKIGFNARYMLDVLSVVNQGDQVRMRLKGPLNPCLIEIPEDEGFLSVVMPLRIEW